MAFTASRTGYTVAGNKIMAWGTFTNDGGSTGGDINTGLHRCESMFFAGSGAAAIADMPSINETLPCAGSAVTIVTTANATGFWFAFGDLI